MSEETQKNVFGEPLEPCSKDPLTGWFRDGFARTDNNDRGLHVVCATMTQEVETNYIDLQKLSKSCKVKILVFGLYQIHGQ